MSAPTSTTRAATDATRILAAHAVRTELADLSTEALENAKLVVLDTLGVMLAALDFPVGRTVVEYVDAIGGGGDARVFGTSVRAPAPLAALAGGTLAHALDYDDHKHLTTHTLPAILAVGERLEVSGADALAAYVVGREVGATIGSIVEAKRKQKRGPTFRGWYRVGVVGPIATAAAVGRLLRLDEEGMARAIGIAASSSAGLRRNQGTMAKALHSGNAASAGINAAFLAQRGFSGDPAILESPLGLVNALCQPGEPEWEPIERFGRPFDIEGRLGVKPFPACSPSHAPLAVLLEIIAEHAVAPADVVAIEADLHPFSLMRSDPQEAIATGFSLPFLLAAAVVNGRLGLDEVGTRMLHDPQVRSLMTRVVHDPEAARPGQPERVTLRLADGRVLTGSIADKPSLTASDAVIAKYRDSAGRRLAPDDVDALLTAVMTWDDADGIGVLLDIAERAASVPAPTA